MKINVTENDILKGDRHSGYRCPVARALKRRTSKKVFVGHAAIYLGRKIYARPANVSAFVEKFDRGFDVAPFSFDLPVKK